MIELQRVADALDAAVRDGDASKRAELDSVLTRLVRHDHELEWRYVPGGIFWMGSERGEPDERPVHSVRLDGFWMTAVPVSWEAACRLRGWQAPPVGMPEEELPRDGLFALHMETRIRLTYCEDQTTCAMDWHAHDPSRERVWSSGGESHTSQELFGVPPRLDPSAPYTYADKPMVAVSWQAARELAEHLSSLDVAIDLPSEAQWERAARGLHTNARYPWGDEDPDPSRCDYDGFARLHVARSRSLPPNDYGLFGMSGGVWEWCLDGYDATFYRRSPDTDPVCALESNDPQYVLRGGSWTDDARACTVSFRMGLESRHWRDGGGCRMPNVGFRLVLTGL